MRRRSPCRGPPAPHSLQKKRASAPGILFDRRGAVLPPPQPGPIARQNLVFVHVVLLSCCFLLPFIMPYLQQLIYNRPRQRKKNTPQRARGAAVACFFQRYFPVEMQGGAAGLRTGPKTTGVQTPKPRRGLHLPGGRCAILNKFRAAQGPFTPGRCISSNEFAPATFFTHVRS